MSLSVLKKLFFVLFIGLLLAAGALGRAIVALREQPGCTVVLVRHAEKQAGSSDPSLTPEGAARAGRLASMLADKGGTPVVRVFSSEARRTQETAEPLARKLGLPVTVVPARDVAGLTAQLSAAPRGGVSVVVGHSNTVPMLISALTDGRSSPSIDDDDFGSMFVVSTAPFSPPSVVRLRY